MRISRDLRLGRLNKFCFKRFRHTPYTKEEQLQGDTGKGLRGRHSTWSSQIAKDNKINKRFAANRGAEEENATKKPKHSGKKKKEKGQGAWGKGHEAGKGESQLLQVCKLYLCVLLWAYLKSQSFAKSDSDSNSGIEGEPIEDGAHMCMYLLFVYMGI